MDKYERHRKTWRILYFLLNGYVSRKFNLEHEDICPEGPCIIIPNHVSEWDPLMVAMSFPKKQMYYVASEHLFRKGLVTKILNYLVEPIPRKKATTGTDTVKACLRHLRAGRSICLYAEGDASWNGISGKVVPSTGKLVRSSGASLLTYRMEGGYLSDPRWGRGTRRGKMKGYPVRLYSPEELKAMSPAEINEAINRDIYEDAWERQKQVQARFKGKNRAAHIENALFLCPKCRRIGTVKGEGDRIKCSCGLDIEFQETGFLSPAQPFENIAQWDFWQHELLEKGEFQHGEELFGDENMCLSRILPEHREEILCRGRLKQYPDRLELGEKSIALEGINQMALVQAHILLLNIKGEYYQIKAEDTACLRKYLAVWEHR